MSVIGIEKGRAVVHVAAGEQSRWKWTWKLLKPFLLRVADSDGGKNWRNLVANGAASDLLKAAAHLSEN